jgi:hypothetical protein
MTPKMDPSEAIPQWQRDPPRLVLCKSSVTVIAFTAIVVHKRQGWLTVLSAPNRLSDREDALQFEGVDAAVEFYRGSNGREPRECPAVSIARSGQNINGGTIITTWTCTYTVGGTPSLSLTATGWCGAEYAPDAPPTSEPLQAIDGRFIAMMRGAFDVKK